MTFKEIDDDFVNKFFEDNKLATKKTIDGWKYTFKGCTLEIDHWLKKRLDHDLVALANAWDLVGAIAGMEGSGKTKGVGFTCATYCASVLHREFNNDNIIFTPEQFIEKVDKARMGEIILWDEFVLGGSSDDTITSMQKALRKKFTIIRSKRLIIFLVLPHFHMMNKYWGVSRTRWLINCVSSDGIMRGRARFYGYGKKRFAYINGKKNMNIDSFKYDKEFEFMDMGNTELTGKALIDFQAYEDKKEQAHLDIDKKDEKTGVRLAKYTRALKCFSFELKDKKIMNFNEMEAIADISARTFNTWYHDMRNEKRETV